jgi:hypothetical protein
MNAGGSLLELELRGHEGVVSGAVFSKDESRILTWSRDGTARLWNAATGTQIGPPLKHDGWVYGAVFSQDESRILTWSDTTARLWNTATGAQIAPPLKHDDRVIGAVFSQDESRILTWSTDGRARQFLVTWTIPRRSIASFVNDVCAAKLIGASITRADDRSSTSRAAFASGQGLRDIDATDIQAAPILRGREGEDVCASRGFLDFLLGTFKLGN